MTYVDFRLKVFRDYRSAFFFFFNLALRWSRNTFSQNRHRSHVKPQTDLTSAQKFWPYTVFKEWNREIPTRITYSLQDSKRLTGNPFNTCWENITVIKRFFFYLGHRRFVCSLNSNLLCLGSLHHNSKVGQQIFR